MQEEHTIDESNLEFNDLIEEKECSVSNESHVKECIDPEIIDQILSDHSKPECYTIKKEEPYYSTNLQSGQLVFKF